MTEQIRKRSTLGTWAHCSFLATASGVGGGLALGMTLSPNRFEMAAAATGDKVILNTWVKVTPDNKVAVFFPRSKMGQGAGTGLAQMLAEEIEADWEAVTITQAPMTEDYINSDLGRGHILGKAANIPVFMYPMIDFALLQTAGGMVGQLIGSSTAPRLTGPHEMPRAGVQRARH